MVPNPNQVVKPETEGMEKVETKPILNAESENKPPDMGHKIMTTFKFKYSAQECAFKTDELLPALATELLRLHHVDNETSYRSWTAQS